MSWNVADAAGFTRHPDHAARWRRLHATSAGSPLLALEFAAAALEAFGSGAERLVWYQAGNDAEIMAIMVPGRLGTWTTFQPAQTPVGFWLQRDTHLDGERLDALLRVLPGPGLMLGLTQCDPMLLARPPDMPARVTLDYIDTARITLSGDFDSYWEKRGKNLRANLKKQRNRLRQEGVTPRLQVSRAEHEMAQAVDDYGRLENTGWKAASGTAVAGENAQGRFYRLLLEAFARQGAASVYRYWLDERLVAMDLCIEGGDCLVVLKTAYDETLEGPFSPALLMREEACRALFDGGAVARIEFYGRVMEWHLRWTGEVRTMYHLNAYRWPWLRRLHARTATPQAAADDVANP